MALSSNDIFRRIMESSGLSQGDMARRLGVTQAAVSHYVRGVRRPSLDDLHQAAEAVGMVLTVDLTSPDEARPMQVDAVEREIIDLLRAIQEADASLGGVVETSMLDQLRAWRHRTTASKAGQRART